MRWSPYERKNEVEIEPTDKEVFIYFAYPNINDPEDRAYLQVDLMHVRAADGIRIHYDGNRDGWTIEQASVFRWDIDDPVCDPKWQEVAFIEAWASKEEQDVSGM